MKEKLLKMLFCLVFAIPFGGIGAVATWVAVTMVHDGYRAQEWVGVKATVDSFDRGSVAYHYTFEGKEYRGSRMGTNPIGGRDNFDSWYFDVSSVLSQAKKSGKTVTVWVNPEDPSESMVDRTIRWKAFAFALPFALGFGGVGVGALLMFLLTLVSLGSSAPASAAAPSGLVATWVFAFFWNVLSFPLAIVIVPGAVQRGEWLGLLMLLFPIIGVLMLWSAISQTITAIKNTIRRAFTRKTVLVERPSAPQAAPAPAAPVNDGFARGMLDDPRASGAMADGGSLIDTTDDFPRRTK